ncbi:CST complex subunit TEN1 isoform X2 [Arabidopsis lyrata subsp. lyrata]|uniref:CST complex subunit TEN1 isoform X2 n=1 Tax=Arabidopsis lyrata subsp. lyrata TaxID=81972 RepID=UPI000A29DBB6|nr:CST complex subunit TEN1 isoform X2 [Arabidopsis lyrata subsp. lyrata]|eukprot:XP_020868316.1 CST complex subunit TEN1 isoform X2 [Arabidopsis lyrata subsp. lyrata]
MANTRIEPGVPITLQELYPSSQFYKEAVSLRVTGMLSGYSVETAIGVIEDGGKSLKINTQNLRDISFRVGSIYQFIGELHIEPNNEARTGRNVDGIDMNLYRKTVELLRQFLKEEGNSNMVE